MFSSYQTISGPVFSFLFGCTLGSFANVLIARLPLDQSIISPGSKCPHCQTAIRFYDNLPIVSYFLLKGRCRNCQGKISFRYPVVEFLTGILFVAASGIYGFEGHTFFQYWPLLTILIAIVFIDLDHRIIPDELNLAGIIIAFLSALIFGDPTLLQFGIGLTSGFLIFFLFAYGYEKVTGRSGMGGGDVKLLAMLGANLGFEAIFFIILASSVLGSVIGISAYYLEKLRTKPTTENNPIDSKVDDSAEAIMSPQSADSILLSSIPYGPFLVLAALLFLFMRNESWFHYLTPI